MVLDDVDLKGLNRSVGISDRLCKTKHVSRTRSRIYSSIIYIFINRGNGGLKPVQMTKASSSSSVGNSR
jgi:hypothetical protein